MGGEVCREIDSVCIETGHRDIECVNVLAWDKEGNTKSQDLRAPARD